MNCDYILTIIDVQECYEKECENLNFMTAIENSILDAIEHNTVILLVRQGNSPIHKRIIFLLEKYIYKISVYKNQYDGSVEILNVLKENNIRTDTMKICGLYTQVCIDSTVRALSKAEPNMSFEILLEACYPYGTQEVCCLLVLLNLLPNVTVINDKSIFVYRSSVVNNSYRSIGKLCIAAGLLFIFIKIVNRQVQSY
jgi:hypothetical protein